MKDRFSCPICALSTAKGMKSIMKSIMLNTKRAYEPAAPSDGYRILVDRLWPRGISKEKAKVDLWAKEITPSPELRQAFHKGIDSFDIFKQKYLRELSLNPAIPDFIANINQKLKEGPVTLIYGAKDPIHNHVVILKDYLNHHGLIA